jgi:hypothetical protein
MVCAMLSSDENVPAGLFCNLRVAVGDLPLGLASALLAVRACSGSAARRSRPMRLDCAGPSIQSLRIIADGTCSLYCDFGVLRCRAGDR